MCYLVYMSSAAPSRPPDLPDDDVIQVGIRDFRHHLSEYLRRAAAGETIEITDRGTPVARLGSVPEREMSFLEREVAAGRMTPPTHSAKDRKWPEPLKLPPGSPSLSEIAQQLRDEEYVDDLIC